MEGTRRETRRMGLRGQGDLYSSPGGKVGVGEDVGKCGHWDAEYDAHGYCRDLDCKRERLLKALQCGDAFMTKDGILVWTHK